MGLFVTFLYQVTLCLTAEAGNRVLISKVVTADTTNGQEASLDLKRELGRMNTEIRWPMSESPLVSLQDTLSHF